MTYYEILEISEKASQEVIRMAYKALCKKYHPDVYQGDKHYAEEQMKKINEAYITLSDELKKKEYDASLNNKKQSKHSTYSENKQEHTTSNIDALIKRGFMALEDGEWIKADNFFEQVLNQDAELAEAYLGKLMVELQVNTKDTLKDSLLPFDESSNYKRAYHFANNSLREFLVSTIQHIKKRNYVCKCDSMYEKACELMDNYVSILSLEEALELFLKISDYKDSNSKIEECKEKIKSIKERIAEERKNSNKIIKSITICSTIVIALIISVVLILKMVIIPRIHYKDAMKFLEDEDYVSAMFSFTEANGYKDSEEQIGKLQKNFDYKISTDYWMTVALKKDGTVLGTGYNIEFDENNRTTIQGWKNIIDVETGYDCALALKLDGTVVAVGNNKFGELDVQSWKNITDISSGLRHTVGLKSDGTVVATGRNEEGQCNVDTWSDILAVSAGRDFTIGLKSDGTVLCAGAISHIGNNCDVSSWSNIVAISAGDSHVVGLKSDGTVVAVGDVGSGECDVENWNDIIAISAGGGCTVGLKANGTVFATRTTALDNYYKISHLNNIVAIDVDNHLFAVKADGTVVAIKNMEENACDTNGWDLD